VKFGCSKVCITPPVGVDLSGYGLREQPSVGIHDDLFARALFLEQGTEKLLWLHCDLIGLERDRVRTLRKRLLEEMNLAEHQILISTTHTHAGPATRRVRGCGEINPAYLDQLDRCLLEAARHAVIKTDEVTLWFAEGRCYLGIDRRSTPTAHMDPVLPVIAFEKKDGTFSAVLANYAMHNVALSSNNRLVSADMAGVAASYACEQLRGNPLTFVTNGACGNINPPKQSDDFSAAEQLGKELGGNIVDLVHRAERSQDTRLASIMETVKVPLTVLSAAEVEREYHHVLDAYASVFPGDFHDVQMKAWRDETLALIEKGQPRDYVETDLQALRIGPARFAAIGAEVFSRMAEELRAAVGKHTYVIGYSNGLIGYLPFAEAYAEGGYEVEYAHKLYMNFNLRIGGYELLRDRVLQLFKKIQ
jgi:neutral ceramidase